MGPTGEAVFTFLWPGEWKSTLLLFSTSSLASCVNDGELAI